MMCLDEEVLRVCNVNNVKKTSMYIDVICWDV